MHIKTYRLALIGFGNVGRGLVQLLMDKKRMLQFRPEIAIVITAISDMHLGYASNPAGLDLQELLDLPNEPGALSRLPSGRAAADNEAAICADFVDIVAELTFTNPKTGEPAITHCNLAKSHGKHAITTNKGPVALAGGRLRYDARYEKLAFHYEGSVMSGTPVLRFATEVLEGAKITAFRGILNGTANFVLGQIETGESAETAIQTAQRLGYAEADPTADIGGSDVLAKVRILSGEVFGYGCRIASETVQGITDLDSAEVQDAQTQGYRWKLIGEGRLGDDGEAYLSVKPQRLPLSDPLAGIGGVLNGITFTTDVLDDVTVIGPGAGRVQTAFALLSDILDIHRKSRQPIYQPVAQEVR